MSPTLERQDKTRNSRLEVRLSNTQKALFQRAAALTDRTLSDLVIDSTLKAATKIVQEHEIIRLSREEQIAFVSALLGPAKPGERLRKAARRYQQNVVL